MGVRGDVEGEDWIKAVVVPDGRCEERELIRFCAERLANYSSGVRRVSRRNPEEPARQGAPKVFVD